MQTSILLILVGICFATGMLITIACDIRQAKADRTYYASIAGIGVIMASTLIWLLLHGTK